MGDAEGVNFVRSVSRIRFTCVQEDCFIGAAIGAWMFGKTVFGTAFVGFVILAYFVAAAVMAVLRTRAARFSVVANIVPAEFASTTVPGTGFTCFPIVAGVVAAVRAILRTGFDCFSMSGVTNFVTAGFAFSAVLWARFACFTVVA